MSSLAFERERPDATLLRSASPLGRAARRKSRGHRGLGSLYPPRLTLHRLIDLFWIFCHTPYPTPTRPCDPMSHPSGPTCPPAYARR